MEHKNLEDCGFALVETIDCPIPDVNPNAKQYIYKRTQSNDSVVFDIQQNGIKISGSWYNPSDFAMIVQRARELEMQF